MLTSITMPPLADHEDAELVQASLAGNREAFGRLVARYQSLICSLAYSATGSLSQSEDLAQETFLTAWQQLASLREPAKVRAWLCGIARNLIYSSLRAQQREPSHRAAALEDVPESHSLEPCPVDRAISREEADILWRSLERIPDTYREPLVLFYREQQSMEMVARHLEISEETLRQRLSRGRKLLQEEVLAFVEATLEKTAPGKIFTLAVVAALPIGITSAKAASATATMAMVKGGAGAKSLLSLGAWISFLPLPVAILFSWKNVVDDSKSPRERRLTRRVAVYQVAFFIVSLVAILCLIPLLLERHPLVFGLLAAGWLLLAAINGAIGMNWLIQRRMEIRAEDGTLVDATVLQPVTRRQAFRKTIRVMAPLLLLNVAGIIGLPWKTHWERSALVALALTLILLWSFRRFRSIHAGQFSTGARWSGFVARYRMLGLMIAALVPGLLGAAIGFGLPLFLHPETARSAVAHLGLSSIGSGLLLGLLPFAGIAGLYLWITHRQATAGTGDGGFLGRWIVPLVTRLGGMLPGVGSVVEKTYGPFFQQQHLSASQCARLKQLILQKTMPGVRLGIALMNRQLSADQRATLQAKAQSETAQVVAQIRQFLGEELYPALRAYEQTIPERTLINQFQSKWAGTNQVLSAEQSAQLLAALSAARERFPWTSSLSRRDQPGTEYVPNLNQQQLEIYDAEEKQFHQQFQAEAAGVLPPAQLTAFGEFLAQQHQAQLIQFKTAAKLFAPQET